MEEFWIPRRFDPNAAEGRPLFPLIDDGKLLLLPTLVDAEEAGGAEIELAVVVILLLSLRPLLPTAATAVDPDVDGNGESLLVLLLLS